MAEFLVRLVVVFGVFFGVAYGITRASKSRSHKKLQRELDEARSRLASLKQALDEGSMDQREHDELAKAILERARDRGVPLDEPAEGDAAASGAEQEIERDEAPRRRKS